MTLRELLDTLKGLGAKLTLHDGDTITLEPPDVLTPAIRAALIEHHAALVALIRSGPASTSSFDALMTAFDGLGARPSAEVLHERLQTLAAGLTGSDPLFRALVRAEAIARLEALGVRAAARLVDAALTARLSDAGRLAAGRGLLFPDPDPWPEAVDAAPILALCSPLKRCGKTTTEDLTTALAQRPLAASNLTVAALYRTVEHWAPTLIVDEADTFLLNNLALRGVLNSGHTRATAFVVRAVGQEPRLFSTWGARMIALIGRLPATLDGLAMSTPSSRSEDVRRRTCAAGSLWDRASSEA